MANNIDPTALLMGWLAGKRMAAMRASSPSGEPIAYLYNGVKLPALPEWDRNKYPYACISPHVGYHSLRLWSVVPVVKDDPDSYVDGYGSLVDAEALVFDATPWDSAWIYRRVTENAGGYLSIVAPVWSNTDLYTTDGKLYLTASDPVPVYE